jgi:DNA polymerase
MKVTDFKNLKELHEYYAIHNSCKLKKVATQPVYECDIPSSGIVFIGEAPGKNEDMEGRPFVGKAGKLLDKLLTSISLTRKDVYVTNVVKYRPPQNREPNDQEKGDCRIWFNAELLYINPKVLVPMGKHALERFVPDGRISASHGQAFEHTSGIPIFAMYHPAVALYNPDLETTLYKDMERLKLFLDGKIKVKETPTLEEKSFSKEKQSLIEDITSL